MIPSSSSTEVRYRIRDSYIHRPLESIRPLSRTIIEPVSKSSQCVALPVYHELHVTHLPPGHLIRSGNHSSSFTGNLLSITTITRKLVPSTVAYGHQLRFLFLLALSTCERSGGLKSIQRQFALRWVLLDDFTDRLCGRHDVKSMTCSTWWVLHRLVMVRTMHLLFILLRFVSPWSTVI